MQNNGYIIDGNNAAILFSKHIYDSVSSLVENVANLYKQGKEVKNQTYFI